LLEHYERFERGLLEEGIKKGREKEKIETAKNLLAMNLEVEQIAKATGLSIKNIENLKE